MNQYVFSRDSVSPENFRWWRERIRGYIELGKEKGVAKPELDSDAMSYAIWCFIRGCNADALAHPNLCGFGKAVIEVVLTGDVRELVLVNCCDSIRSVMDILRERGGLDFLYRCGQKDLDRPSHALPALREKALRPTAENISEITPIRDARIEATGFTLGISRNDGRDGSRLGERKGYPE